MPADLAARRVAAPVRIAAHLGVRDVFDLGAAALARRFKAGDLTARQFEALMRELVSDVHVAAYAAGRSGRWAAIEPAEWRRVARTIDDQYRFLRGFRAWLRDTPPDDVSEAAVYQRARLYGAASRQSFVRAELADLGLAVELPAYPGDGTTECRANCKCGWSVRTLSKARGDFNVSWRLGDAEHCRQCRKRSRAWKGLRVRGHVLVDGYETLGTFR